ncbi:MAG: hypothetical protein KQI35_00215 [Bacteroidetes bacterium]|nr:hypothetical protein [Bacteroidota bacterium]
MKRILILFVLLSITLLSCRKNKDHDDTPQLKNPFINTWEFVWFEDNVQYMLKTTDLPDNKYGFQVLPDGTFIESKNATPCDTNSCFEYGIYQGTWLQTSDDIYHLSVPYWGGNMEYDIKVLSIAHDTLKYTIPYPPQ